MRIRDGAKLILPASQASDGGYAAENDGITYTVTSSALVVSAGQTVIRKEAMVDFHGSTPSQSPAGTTSPSTSSGPPACAVRVVARRHTDTDNAAAAAVAG